MRREETEERTRPVVFTERVHPRANIRSEEWLRSHAHEANTGRSSTKCTLSVGTNDGTKMVRNVYE